MKYFLSHPLPPCQENLSVIFTFFLFHFSLVSINTYKPKIVEPKIRIKEDKTTRDKSKHDQFYFYVSWIFIMLHGCFCLVLFLNVSFVLDLYQDDDITQQRHKCKGDAGKTPMLKSCHSFKIGYKSS